MLFIKNETPETQVKIDAQIFSINLVLILLKPIFLVIGGCPNSHLSHLSI